MLICIDPGHGGKDPGATKEHPIEAKINLHVALMLHSLCNQINIESKLTRYIHDDFLTPLQRANYANALKADLFLSIHCNAAENKQAIGIEAFHHPKKSAEFANIMVDEFSKFFPEKRVRRGMAPNSSKSADYSVLRNSNMPSCLFELGFLSNDIERSWLDNVSNQLKCAEALVLGINKFKQLKNW
jgi:N-acetylmuramoyl-L-alanine amidase